MFLHVVCVFMISVFKLCGLQGTRKRLDLWVGIGEAKLGLGFICVYVVGGGRLWWVVE